MAYNIVFNLDFYRALRASVTYLTYFSEAISCFNLWIITPKPSNNEISNGVTPLIPIIAYAILEPFATKLFFYVAIRPWILLLALSPIHLYLALLSMEVFDWLTSIQNAASHSRRAVPSDIDKVPSSNTLKSEKPSAEKVYTTMSLVIPVFTAALINAALLLFSQSLYATSLLEKNPSIPFLAAFTIIFNLICRLGDYVIWNRAQKGRSPGQSASSGLVEALIHQLALFTIRACMRIAIGLAPLMAFETPTPFQAEDTFAPEQYQWLEQLRLPPLVHKLQLGIALGFPFLMLLGGYLIMKGLKEDSSVRSEQQ